jgi:succinyldiaminopimelate transaminase
VKSLPDFPWDTISKFRELAQSHPQGFIDLSVGTPVDPVPEVIQNALKEHSNTPGYPTTIGTVALRKSAVSWLERKLGVTSLNLHSVIPTIGSKELISWLPTILDCDTGKCIAIPATAYPTYEVSAIISRNPILRYSSIADLLEKAKSHSIALVWLNSPSNPTGQVLSIADLRDVVSWSQINDVIIASDECYIELGWDVEPHSILNKNIATDNKNLLAIHSLSKRSNMAGYRAGLISGDQSLIESILEFRKHAGMMVPMPIQHAMQAALEDDEHVQIQKATYRNRRALLKSALESSGFRVDFSEAGLYLWVSQGKDSRHTLQYFAERGILVAPGDFYGDQIHCRVALTASDSDIQQAASRISA